MDLQTVTDVLGSIASAIAIVSAIIIAVRYLRDRRKRGNRDKDDTPPGSGSPMPVVVVLVASGTVVIFTVVAHAATLPSNLLNALVFAQITLLSGVISSVIAVIYQGLRVSLYQRDAQLAQLQSVLAGVGVQLRSLQDISASASLFSSNLTSPESSNALANLGAAIAAQSNMSEQIVRLLEQQNALASHALADLQHTLEQLRMYQEAVARASVSQEQSVRELRRSVEQLAALISEVYGVDRMPPDETWDSTEPGERLSAPGSRAIRRRRSRWRFWSRR